ncbi:MAG TPA: tRNA lysidine(34) synthetase TilS [Oxalicibacterium sp.]|uniref:tRNA lysidine(34) synthetase TilS n=1 Tax=Oxalicibacterium sp. TaxID=2766525 RepID=UPI002CA3E456|nr:tRNA lysidine(34) synthetase TilS [Oxalicibacterium sp.]HWU98452.1 tRNA lysidine(34) synthetase TilS [Oxalicibacterium sp.]
MTTKQIPSLQQEFERALGEIRTRVSLCTTGLERFDLERIAVAYSGGLDSAVLLSLLQTYAAQHQLQLFAFHVHHGLSPNADQWLEHCEAQCGEGVTFDARRIQLERADKNGIEEAARHSRYAALGEMCLTHRVPLLLTAHHQDDQAETVLLQLLRGSGVAGLSGMDKANHAADLLGDSMLLMGRPLLQSARTDLEAWANEHAIDFVEDESNADTRYARNALRHQVMPVLARHFPGFQQRFARTAQHAQSAQRLLVELAAQDLAACLDGDCLDVTKLEQFGTDRVDNMLRYWFGSRGIRMPSTAWLNEMRTQLFEAKHDAQLCVTHADCHIRRHRNLVFITPKLDPAVLEQTPVTFNWNGESSLHFAEFSGTLYFETAEQGIDIGWLAERQLTIALRSGGERLKLAWNRPTRNLKVHYQACDVPAWERERLPLVFAGGQLLFAAGVGMDCHAFATEPGVRVGFRWEFDSV